MNARLALNVTPHMLLHLLCMPRLRLQRLSRASSASAASALQRQVDELQGGLIALRGAMDARVVGHDDIKHAALLGLLSKEHVYIEGPTRRGQDGASGGHRAGSRPEAVILPDALGHSAQRAHRGLGHYPGAPRRRQRRCGRALQLRPALLQDACALVPHVPLGRDTEHCLVRLLQVLRDEHGCSAASGALLSDRTFLVKAVTVVKAQALLRGAAACERADLSVLRHMTTFRVPTPAPISTS